MEFQPYLIIYLGQLCVHWRINYHTHGALNLYKRLFFFIFMKKKNFESFDLDFDLYQVGSRNFNLKI